MHFKDAIAASIFTAHMTIFSLRNAQNRSIERKRSEQRGPKHGAQRGPTGGCALHHLLPAQQKDANHTPNPGGAVHQPPVKLPAGSLRSVSSL